MINNETILAYMRQESYRPLSYKDLLEALQLTAEDEAHFSELMGKLEKEGEIVRTRRDKYGLPEKMNIYRGIIKLSQRGYGILITDQVGDADIFVYGRNLNGAMHEDRVMVRIQERANADQRPEGEVIRVITCQSGTGRHL